MKVLYCRRGHPKTGENLMVKKSGYLECRTCKNAATAKHNRLTKFGGNRELAIQRDGEKCVKCGMTRAEHYAKYAVDITVDHIDGNGCYKPAHLKNNALDNLQTLCMPCHGKKDSLRLRASRSKLVMEDARDIRMFSQAGMSRRDILKGYQMVTYSVIAHIINKDNFKEGEV